ncbi:MAG: hypothetical protein HY647_03685 [Acidobacteria bacterium]|nr:hypothetical protein [Acidobacteriota bacterium]
MTMTPQTSDWAIVIERLEKLEKLNRRMKQMGALALVAIALAFATSHLLPLGSLEANEFILKDDRGRIRGKFFMDEINSRPSLVMYGEEDKASVTLTPIWGLELFDQSGRTRVNLSLARSFHGGDLLRRLRGEDIVPRVSDAIPRLTFTNDKGYISLSGDPEGFGLRSFYSETYGTDATFTGDEDPAVQLQRLHTGQNVSLSVSADGPSLSLHDTQGFETTIGTTSLVTPRTGETHTTSAASVVMVDKDKNVIWKAP